jgi:hypothetical protein
VPLNDIYPKTVVFMIAESEHHGVSARTAIGTGFYVGFPSPTYPKEGLYTYVVTAGHVVEGKSR